MVAFARGHVYSVWVDCLILCDYINIFSALLSDSMSKNPIFSSLLNEYLLYVTFGISS